MNDKEYLSSTSSSDISPPSSSPSSTSSSSLLSPQLLRQQSLSSSIDSTTIPPSPSSSPLTTPPPPPPSATPTNSPKQSHPPVLIRIHLTDSYAASTTLKVTTETTASDVCQAISSKLGLSEEEKMFDSLVCVINAYDGKTPLHWLKTLKKSDLILQFQSQMLTKRSLHIKSPEIINSLTTSWYYKDIRSIPLNLEGDISGNSSSDDENEISLNDLIYFGTGDRRSILYKRSNKDHNLWRKRLCILNDKLWCINLKKKSPYASCIQLNGKIMTQEEAPDLNYPHGIIIQIPNQATYFFRANSKSEQQIWKEELVDRAVFGIDNAVIYMGEMIICDEEYARGQKKQKLTLNTLQRDAIWRVLKESATLPDPITEECVLEEKLTIKIPQLDDHMNGCGPRRSECSIDEDHGGSTPTVISYGLNESHDSGSRDKDDLDQQVNLNADEAFIPRDPQARMDAYIKYRSSYTSTTVSSKPRPVSRRIAALRNNSTISSSSAINPKDLVVDTSSNDEPTLPPLSSLPCAPIRCVHSFHTRSPLHAAAVTLIDAIHDYKSAFRHDIHLTPRTLWSLALELYYTHFQHFVYAAQNTSSPWAATMNYLPLHPHLPPSVPDTDGDINIDYQQPTINYQNFTTQEIPILVIFERLKNSLLSNLQREVIPKKKAPKKTQAEQQNYWFWPSIETATEDLFRREDKKAEAEEARQRSLISVGYELQIMDTQIRPPITIFDELLGEDVLV